MLCVSIYQKSRQLALVDMLNASRQGDMIEIRLDRFSKDPNAGELLQHKSKPVICSCRRPKDGGDWDGTEEERQALLRSCVVSGADYVELEMDIAANFRRYGTTKRVISYTNLEETPGDIAAIYAGAQTKNPDVIKLVTRVNTPEEAWPLVQILVNPPVPTVVVGLGPSGTMLTILARRMGAPWSYAALEKGMESYPGQKSVEVMRSIYHHPEINNHTRFIGVVGSEERDEILTALVNAAMVQLESPLRCLPLEVGSVKLFQKVVQAVKIHSILVDSVNANRLGEMITQYHGLADRVKMVDILGLTQDHWSGFLLEEKAIFTALCRQIQSKPDEDNSVQGKTFLLTGITPISQLVAMRIVKQGGILIVTDRDRTQAARLAQELHCRVVQFEALYTTLHDVLIIGSDKAPAGVHKATSLQTNYLRQGMTVVDLTSPLRASSFLIKAAQRGCNIVHPADVIKELVNHQVKLMTGKEVPVDCLNKAFEPFHLEEESENQP